MRGDVCPKMIFAFWCAALLPLPSDNVYVTPSKEISDGNPLPHPSPPLTAAHLLQRFATLVIALLAFAATSGGVELANRVVPETGFVPENQVVPELLGVDTRSGNGYGSGYDGSDSYSGFDSGSGFDSPITAGTGYGSGYAPSAPTPEPTFDFAAQPAVPTSSGYGSGYGTDSGSGFDSPTTAGTGYGSGYGSDSGNGFDSLPTGAPTSGGSGALPACFDPIGFNAGYGPCRTYSAGQGNANYNCAYDTHAERDCAECGKCSSSTQTQPTQPTPSAQPTVPTYSGYGSGYICTKCPTNSSNLRGIWLWLTLRL